jgi:DNA-binding transcriptional LysR family regulator
MDGAAPFDELDLRRLRAFVAVAEREHFSRAAEALHITQPALSRQVKALEAQLGLVLLERGSGGVRLTPAGQQLLGDARTVLGEAQAAVRRARRVARGDAHLTVGFRSGVPVAPALRALAARRPDVTADVRSLEYDDQLAAVLDGTVDVAYVRGDAEADGVATQPLWREPRVVILPEAHPLAAHPVIARNALAGERLLGWGGAQAEVGLPGPPVRTVAEKLAQVAAGRGLAVLPRSAAHGAAEDAGLVVRPTVGFPEDEVALAWSAGNRADPVPAFLEAAETVVDDQRRLARAAPTDP